MTPLDAALAYARAGLNVIPIKPGAKRPPMGAWQDAATTDPDTIRRWWTTLYADHGVGLAPGRLPDGRWWFAVDIDDHDIDGHAAWAELLAAYPDHPPAAGPDAVTGGGGRHLLFAAPFEVRNADLDPGIDIRGHGGQIVAEPTIHPNGRPYAWEDGAAPWDLPIPDAPPWLLAMLQPAEPVHEPDNVPQVVDRTDIGDRPGDIWAAQTTWDELLTADGWTRLKDGPEGEQRWTRPGKNPRDGISATVGYKGSDVLKVFTSSVPELDADATYTKLGYYAATRHGGDHSAAASALRALGHHRPEADVDAWLDGLTNTPQDATQPTDWPDPTPITPETPHTGDWPADTLPDWMDAHVTAVANALQVPRPLCAQLAVGALAAICMGRATIALSSTWHEPLNAYLCGALPPGGGKSPAYKQIIGPLHDWEAERRALLETSRREAEAKAKVARKRYTTIEAKMAKGAADEGEVVDALLAAEAAEAAVPAKFRLFAADATPEAVAVLLERHNERLAMMSTESDLIDQAAGLYGDKVNLSVYLKAWSGEPIQVDRIKRDSIELRSPLLTVLLTVQPEHLASLHTGGAELRNRGFFDRFMWSLPQGLIGHRTHEDRPIPTTDDYATHIKDLANHVASWGHPSTLTLSPDATHAFTTWADHLEAQMRPQGRLRHVAEAISKLRSTTGRLAGMLHLADDRPGSEPVTGDTMRRAIAIGDYWLANLLALRDLTTDIGRGRAADIEALELLEVIRRKRWTTLAPRNLWLTVKGKRYPSVVDLVGALVRLAETNHVRFIEGDPVDIGQRGTRVRLAVHPSICREDDAEEGENAREPRERARDLARSPEPVTCEKAENARVARVGQEGGENTNPSLSGPEPVDNPPDPGPDPSLHPHPPRDPRDPRVLPDDVIERFF